MKLIDWMRRENIGDDAMAERLNDGQPEVEHYSASMIRKWKRGERVPPTAVVIRFRAVTDGAVDLEDWASEPAEAR